MSEAIHTPAPWFVERVGNHISVQSDNMPTWKQVWPRTSSEGRIFVCNFRQAESKCSSDYYEPGARLLNEVNEKNARLIAAAPDLLEGLKDLFKMMDEGLLVRNTDKDGQLDYAIHMLNFGSRLKLAYDAVVKVGEL